MSMNYDGGSVQTAQGGRSYVVTLLLSFLLGAFGAHRFYTGYTVIAIVQLVCTITGFGALFSCLWALVDTVSIALNKYEDADGKPLDKVNQGCGLFVMIWLVVVFVLGGLGAVAAMFIPSFL